MAKTPFNRALADGFTVPAGKYAVFTISVTHQTNVHQVAVAGVVAWSCNPSVSGSAPSGPIVATSGQTVSSQTGAVGYLSGFLYDN